MSAEKFIKYVSIYDPDIVLYGLERGGVEKVIEGVLFLEVTPDFERVQMIRADGLKSTGTIIKEFS